LRFARGCDVVEIPIHGLAPVAMVVSPLRGYENQMAKLQPPVETGGYGNVAAPRLREFRRFMNNPH